MAVARTAGKQRIVYLHEYCCGIPVHDAIVTVTCGADADVQSATGTLLLFEQPTATTPEYTSSEAVRTALVAIKALRPSSKAVELGKFRLVARVPLPSAPTLISHRACRDPAMLHLTWVNAEGLLHLAWRIVLKLRSGRDHEVLVACAGKACGTVLTSALLTRCLSGTSPIFDPYGTLPKQPRPMPLPLSEYPASSLGAPVGFPWDWLDGVQTKGLNVRAGTTPKCRPVNGTLVGGEVQFTPASAQEEQVLHAFYWCNFLHDFFYLYGFDEAAGNFQEQGKQPGGQAGDAIRAVVIDAIHPDPAFIGAVPDGTPPRLALYKFDGVRHTASDPDVLIHEYTHAVVERLCGGWLTWNVGATTAQGLALGEGLSDFFAMSLANYGLSPASRRTAFAAWVTGNATTGLRRHAYDQQFSGTFATLGTPGFQTSHEAGQVWAACLLAIIEQFANRFADPARAARMTWIVVVDSVRRLRTGNGHPTFLDARDAMLAALQNVSHFADFAATNTNALISDLWTVFKHFGMGPAARSPNASFNGLVADF